MSLEEVPVTSVFTEEELSDLKASINGEPQGIFLKGRHGFTHYTLDTPASSSSSKGLVVIAAGIGVPSSYFKEFSDILVSEGYSTLTYDYFGHGYSKGTNKWVEYSPDLFVDQVEDILEYIGTDPTAFIGHSTGGVVSIAAVDRWSKEGSKRSVIPKQVLVAPVLFAKKPFLAKVADTFPNFMTFMMRNVLPSNLLISDAYLEGMDSAFGKEGTEYVYETQYKAFKKDYERVFGKDSSGSKPHPFLAASVWGINANTLRDDLLPGYRKQLNDAVNAQGDNKVDTLLLWGDLDVTVPFQNNVDTYRALAGEKDNFSLMVLNRNGHEVFIEDSEKVAKAAVLPFLN